MTTADETTSFITKVVDEQSGGGDLSQWMTHLPHKLTHIPFNQLAIPGSHDSGAYWLNTDLPIAPGEPCIVSCLGSCAKNIVKRWSLTQKLNLTEQLKHGIRYFDMRACYLETDDDFLFVHGLYGVKISILLQEINTFLSEHPKEVVIIDFNHFYNFDAQLHAKLSELIVSIFAEKNFPPPTKGVEFTLDDIWKENKQVIIFYKNLEVMEKSSEFWPQSCIESPWFNTASYQKLIQCLNGRFETCKKDRLNIFQAILTPQLNTVMWHVCNSLERYLADKCNVAVDKWLAELYEMKRLGVNIVICDFVSSANCPSNIIRLNRLHTLMDDIAKDC